MSQQQINRYKSDLRSHRFLLFEQFKIQDMLGTAPFADWGEEEVNMVLDEVYKWVCDKVGPLNASGDAEGCKLENGEVTTPSGFKEAWKSLYEAGWRSLYLEEEHGGQGAPFSLHAIAEELQSGANPAFNMYPGLSDGVAEVVAALGTPEQIKTYLPRLKDGTFGGTMCLTEPHAGSDVGSNTTKATKVEGRTYKIEGTKIFISAGQQDLSENIIHLVLARTADAPAGTKGLSLFFVPRDKLDGSGSNNVVCPSIEHKMGIRGSSTAVLNFGEGGDCLGELVGEEQQGMRMMFKMMNIARIGVGIQGLAVSSTAYLNALDYAKERVQGSHINKWKDADAQRVTIINHPDVRRMLLDMKAKVDGIRALVCKLSLHVDRERVYRDSDPEKAAYNKGQLDLLVPLLKAYGSDTAFQVCETAIQTYGGAGYTRDYPVEQACRDSKIFSIYEGTNHIQALDLVGRKIGYKGGVNFQAFLKDVNDFIGANKANDELKDGIDTLSRAVEGLGASAMRFLGWFQGGKMEHVPLEANRFLSMMARTTVGWLLLDGATVAQAALKDVAKDHPDYHFYHGLIHSARYYASTELSEVPVDAERLAKEERAPLDITDEAFATV